MIKPSENGQTAFEKLIGYNADILQKWTALEGAVLEKTSLDESFLEQIRRTMAFENGCQYCMAKGGPPDFDRHDPRLSIAAAFARLFCMDHQSISKAHFDMLKKYFSDKEISELCTFIAFIDASQRLGKIFNLTAADLLPSARGSL